MFSLQNQRKKLIVGAKGLKKVFRFAKFRKNKSSKQSAASQKQQQLTSQDAGKMDSHRIRVTTSGSDVSELRHEQTMNAQNRNSSSG